MRLRPDLVLIALPPQARVHRVGPIQFFIYGAPERVGVVLQTGEAVTTVVPHDRVIFDTYAAEDVTVNHWPCVLVPETALDAVVE